MYSIGARAFGCGVLAAQFESSFSSFSAAPLFNIHHLPHFSCGFVSRPAAEVTPWAESVSTSVSTRPNHGGWQTPWQACTAAAHYARTPTTTCATSTTSPPTWRNSSGAAPGPEETPGPWPASQSWR